ncbi:paraquat-inducible protein A [Alteromonas sediminis]|uniref:Paraquat-inducible protein A n=1 Tax=Alteromonas sediminis TaxID=2259342 RepID=A0A3N5Y4S6_9ALTE|nr:paraquat-inducible protein A [Alteromonas sediminis]RPJ68610.1 paraquat-inducible protein A [Alteromonas sediminis]
MKYQPALDVQCPLCAHQVSVPPLSHRQRATCPNCGHFLTGYRNFQTEFVLGLSIAGVLFLLLSLPYQFLSFASNGQKREINLTTGLETLVSLDFLSLAVITALATLILPGLTLIGLATLSFCRKFNHRPRWLARVYRSVLQLIPWSMAEIFLVATLVSLVKITDLATIEIGIGFITFCLFIVCMSFSLFYFDRISYHEWLQPSRQPDAAPLSTHQRQYSIQRTWALLLTACILYIPANTYPIMVTNLFGESEPSTIMGGVITLWQSKSYPIAIIIFFASVVIPIAKLIILAWLNWTVMRQSDMLKQHRTRLYYITEWIGRWSMVDVFVVALLVALIQLGNTISVFPGQAALAFCAVVFFTMIAAMTFDSRLIWQQRERLFEQHRTAP